MVIDSFVCRTCLLFIVVVGCWLLVVVVDYGVWLFVVVRCWLLMVGVVFGCCC